MQTSEMQSSTTTATDLLFKPVAVTVTPGTPPDSAKILIGAAGFAAHDKRRINLLHHYERSLQQEQQQQKQLKQQQQKFKPLQHQKKQQQHQLHSKQSMQHQQQQQHSKTIMNCFRDRSSSYTRCHHQHQNNQAIAQASVETSAASSPSTSGSGSGSGRPEAVVFLRELRTRPNKLALLKSSSSRDLSRLLLDTEIGNSYQHRLPSRTSSSLASPLLVNVNMLNLNKQNPSTSSQLKSSASSASATSSSASASASTSSSSMSTISNYSGSEQQMKAKKQQHQQRSTECCTTCKQHLNKINQRLDILEHDLQTQNVYTKELEHKLNELTKLIATTTTTTANNNDNKLKKSFYNRNKKGLPSPTTATTTVHPSKLVAWMNLSNWWKSRPSIETLKQKNIYNDEPCFDTEIESVLKHEVHKTVPRIVVDCCDLIEELYRRSAQPIEGIYRQCGDYNKIQTLRFNIDANDYASLRQPNIDIHTLSGVLKLFLREIKSPLISTNEAKTFIGKPNQWLLTELPTKIDILKRLIRSLPETNRDTMDYIFAHFNRLTKVPLQQISADTLSISVTPSIFHIVPQGGHMQDMQELLRESETLSDCVKTMIEYHQRIFECSTDRRLRQRLSVRQLKKTLSQPDLLFHNLF